MDVPASLCSNLDESLSWFEGICSSLGRNGWGGGDVEMLIHVIFVKREGRGGRNSYELGVDIYIYIFDCDFYLRLPP